MQHPGSIQPPSHEAKAVFAVISTTCSEGVRSVENAVKRLQGIREAVVDVLDNRVQVLYHPSSVNVCLSTFLYIWHIYSLLCLQLYINLFVFFVIDYGPEIV